MKRITVIAALAALVFAQPASAVLFHVALDAAQEVPAPTLGGATPSGTATVDLDTTTGNININGNYSGMTSNVDNSHLHGLAAPGATAGIIFGLSNSGGTTGSFNGSSTLSPSDLAGLLAGETYINIHTVNNSPGEIRGQVVDPDIRVIKVRLDADQEVPAPNIGSSSPTGMATVVVDMENPPG